MSVSELWAIEMVVAAFAGGAFGAAVGALPSFTLAGLMVIVGELYKLLSRSSEFAVASMDITGSIAFGVVLGPHVAFGGGAAAVAYAAKKGSLDSDFEYHPAKEVTRGLGSKPDVLAVGGLFGVVGYWIATLSAALSLPLDPVALGVVGSALVHRGVFGYSFIGAAPRQLFDMSPFERTRRSEPGEVARTDGGRSVEPWLPYQYRWSHVVMLGTVVGVLGGYIAYVTGSAFLAFGISVVALAFVNAGVPEIPVTHHMSLPASTAVLASVDAPLDSLTPAIVTGAIPLGEVLLLGAVFGGVGALLGEVAQRIFYAHADTHFDPPAASIVGTSLVIGVLALVGVLPGAAWIPLP
ncbi:hypothetical protein [Natrinema caseinilyticum]|uniref:hypothetical protein n=1 Tax=Natrinema caseinilyticum TaxID=2961570 RepID=UPI0020C45293|nr:hypothetical protein [Natrinema caseinilyticum]